MGQQEQATEATREQPIWVQDLIAWLETIQQQNLPTEEWVKRVEEVLAELPGQGLPEEFWPQPQADGGEEADQTKVAAAPQSLINRMSDEDRVRVQRAIDEIKNIEHENTRSHTLNDVATQLSLSESRLQAALDAANRIESYYQLSALAAVATQLPASERQPVFQSALESAKSIEQNYDLRYEPLQALALAAVATQLSPSERQPVFQAALDAANSLADVSLRSRALAAVAAQLPASEPQLLQAALEAAKNTEYKYDRLQTLEAVAAQLPARECQPVLQATLNAANRIEKEDDRLKALAAVAAQLPVSERQPVLQAVLKAAKSFEESYDQSRALVAVAAQLPVSERQLLRAALEAAKSIEYEIYRWPALAAVAAQLPPSEPELLKAALEAAESIEEESYRWPALAAVVAHLPPKERQPVLHVLKAALDATKSISHQANRVGTLSDLAAQLPDSEPELLKAALDAAKDIESEYWRSQALTVVAAQLPDSAELLQSTLETAKGIESEEYRSPVLAAVAAQLPDSEPELLQSTLEAAKGIESDKYRSPVLAAIVAKLPTIESQRLIQSAFVLEHQEDRITVLREFAFHKTEALLLHAPPTLLATFLQIIPEGRTSADRARLLSALAPKLSPGLFPRALQLIQTDISHPAYQAETLANLAPYLPPDLLSEALDLIQHHIPGYSYPTTALCALIPHLPLAQLQTALRTAFIRIGRIRHMPIQSPQLVNQILEAAATRVSNATRSQSKSEDSALTNRLVKQLLQRIQRYITDEKGVARTIAVLAPSLSRDHLEIGLKKILPKLPSKFYRAQALAALATSPHLTPEQLDCLRKAAESLRQTSPKATALSALILHFPDLHSVVAEMIQSQPPDSYLVTELTLILATRPHPKGNDASGLIQLSADQTKTLRQIRNQSRDADQANALVKLAPHLRPDLRLEAQSVAQDIQNPYHQARSLLALATHFPEVRAEAARQIATLQTQDPIQHIELLSQFATTVPEQIPTLLKAIEDWAKTNPFKDDPKGPDTNTFKRRRILIALKPHLPLRLNREIDRQTSIGRTPQDLWERTLFVLRTEYRQALKSGAIRNDAAQDSDLLNLKEEINALTEMLLMRDLEPPVAVGILGGWGGGKSYIMHLMQTHMVAIRSQGMEAIEAWGLKKDDDSKSPEGDRVGRFVGHIYQIKFDAWTYAKTNLWSSLMQTIFFELDRQISLETALREIGIDPLDTNSSEIWRVLYQTNEDDRQYLLEKVLGKEKLGELKEKNKEQQESWTTLLWEQYGVTEIDARNRLSKAKEQLDRITHQLKDLEQSKTTLNKQLTPDKESENWFIEILQETSNISGFLLRKYFGKEIADDLRTEIENKLKKANINTSDLNQINHFINQTVSEILDEDQITLENGDTKYSLSWMALRRWANKNRQLIVTVVILLGCALLGPLVAHWINPQNIIAQLSWLITPLIPAISLTQNLLKSHQKWFAQAKQSVQDYQKTLKNQSENKFHNLISKKQANELQKLDSDINKLRNQQKSLEQEITQAQNDLPSDKFASLASFVNATVKGERYDRELGIMHQVKTDLSKLSQALLPPPYDSEEYKNKLNKLRKVFPRGPARVVLFIDDLDRCAPDTVVEVLEAVQLLVKNPLFIAVLAIDERYINRALAKHYKGVLSLQGRPSAADYLEKIIQIPYRIRPIDETALRSYLRAQVVVQDSETSGTKFNEFSPQEFNLLVQCCQESELSPRSLKRLTNVYKLYKVLSRTRGHRPTYREQKAILILLAFSNRYADLMRDIIEAIGSHYEEGKHLIEEDGKTETLSNIIHTYLDKYERLNPDSILIQDVKKLRHDVNNLVDKDLELKEIRQIFDFVRSFSFVGDIGADYTPSSIFAQSSVNFGEEI
ncbi:MAG: hypothetical protein B0A82_11565 [Alkalinema sp. CACIAM 70d]|nr:MAG: hypothetical protein B0A82_11565 [Alkalinema sp. CACIAM 70d]